MAKTTAPKTKPNNTLTLMTPALSRRIAQLPKAEIKRGFGDLCTAFAQSIPPDDRAVYDDNTLFDAAYSLWQFAQLRKNSIARVRIVNRDKISALEIVTTDTPFLLDSTLVELQRLDIGVHLSIYPVLYVERDAQGKLLHASCAPSARATAEALMVIEIDRHTAPDMLAHITRSVEKILGDVGHVVNDWQPMQKKLQETIADLEQLPKTISASEKNEAKEFLSWLLDKHFIFMGYREYRFVDKAGQRGVQADKAKNLGVLRDNNFVLINDMRQLEQQPKTVQDKIGSSQILFVTKADSKSTVHRNAFVDRIGVKIFDRNGKIVGERLFAGLFTTLAYSRPVSDVPFIRQKTNAVLHAAGFDKATHDGKALAHILETYPRDELFQIDTQTLLANATGILQLQEREKTALFVRYDVFGRFASCLVYFPRDRFSTTIRLQIQNILESTLGGKCTDHALRVDQSSVLAQLYITVDRQDKALKKITNPSDINNQLQKLAVSWTDQLRMALMQSNLPENKAQDHFRVYGPAFPESYQQHYTPAEAVQDIAVLHDMAQNPRMIMRLEPARHTGHNHHCKIFSPQFPVPLSSVLPILEHMNLRVVSELPHEIQPTGNAPQTIWLHDFVISVPDHLGAEWIHAAPAIEEAFERVMTEQLGLDGFNGLLVTAGLNWRQVNFMRGIARYLRQIRLPYSQSFIDETLNKYPHIVRLLADYFDRLHNPAHQKNPADNVKKVNALRQSILTAMQSVTALDEDKILRRYVNIIDSILRTNYFQTTASGAPKDALALKLDSTRIDGLPLPRPMIETFIYSPRVEAIHLRTSKVARGGIRWSDRRQDYRDEVLGLVKAQNVKNSIIVPSGAKGGFFVKKPPAGRDAFQAEGIECYKIMVRSLLDITDNLVAGKIIKPQNVVCHDGDDHYLVVAADKGTATFSNIANAISQEHGFWLDDAFASGGSTGYDHKHMAITARGAWESVKRHFREMGKDCQTTDFTAIGVGDMAGDVFGNGMLLSRHLRLIGAFNYAHIFCDPNPDAAISFRERQRLFNLPRSQWTDYDTKCLSKGGRIYSRSDKSLALTPEIKQAFGITSDSVTPDELMTAILKADVELAYFGGIGTYIKASHETDNDVRDKANDAIRINGSDLRAKIIGEGANLGMTQLGRVEYATKGGRINTDFIDNAAGVNTSDHEVNIKILFRDVLAAKKITRKERDALLVKMTDDVAGLVLRDNYLQTQALTVAQNMGPAYIQHQARLMWVLEKSNMLDRGIEYLPSDGKIADLTRDGLGLTRPDLSVLLSYAKMNVKRQLAQSDFLADMHKHTALQTTLHAYFPERLQKSFAPFIDKHSLRDAIVGTAIANQMVNYLGPTIVSWMIDLYGLQPADIARAFVVARDVFGLTDLWHGIESLDGVVPASLQSALFARIIDVMDQVIPWFLRHASQPLDITRTINQYQSEFKGLQKILLDVLPTDRRTRIRARKQAWVEAGVPAALATQLAGLKAMAASMDITRLAAETGWPQKDVAQLYYAIGERFELNWLYDQTAMDKTPDYWSRQALMALQEDFHGHHVALTKRIMTEYKKTTKQATSKKTTTRTGIDANVLIDDWRAANTRIADRVAGLLADLRHSPRLDVAIFSVMNRRLQGYLSS